MLTDDECRACLKAIGLPAMSPRRFREIVAAINAMPDGPVWVVPREASGGMLSDGLDACAHYDALASDVRGVYVAMTAAGAAELGEE